MDQDTWTIKRMLNWTSGYLEQKGDEHPRLSAEWLISNVTGLTRVQIYMSFDRVMSAEELSAMHDAVVRRAKGEPLQYVTGEMPFRHIVLHCERGVLIPRPETEILVDAALEGVDAAVKAGQVWPDVEERAREHEEAVAESDKEAQESVSAEQGIDADMPATQYAALIAPDRKPYPAGPRVLEVGTGTGCIALSMASERRGTHVVATDLSEQAVKLAERNREALGLEDSVDILHCNLADGVSPKLMGTFSVLVSNPPYIPSDVVPTLPEEVIGYEPGLALDGGADGLDVFRELLELAPQALAPGGWLCVELFETTVARAAELVRQQPGWASAEVREDLTYRPRVLVAVREGA